MCIRTRKPRRKIRPANEVTESEINSLLQSIKDFDGYPKLKDLGRLAPSLTPLQINVIVRYLERARAIILDTEGYIVWSRKEREQMPLGEVAEMSDDIKEFLKSNPE